MRSVSLYPMIPSWLVGQLFIVHEDCTRKEYMSFYYVWSKYVFTYDGRKVAKNVGKIIVREPWSFLIVFGKMRW